VAYHWPSKDPNEILDYSIDWSRFLGNATISTVAWSVSTPSTTKTAIGSGVTVDGIQNISQTNTSTVATINLGSGTLNKEYTFFCSITDNTGSTAERSVRLRIREQ
jgi:hypothetical protein